MVKDVFHVQISCSVSKFLVENIGNPRTITIKGSTISNVDSPTLTKGSCVEVACKPL